MKRILFILSIALLSSASLSAQSPSGRTYPNGIYLFCGNEIPRTFYYLIERRDAAGLWQNVAKRQAPQNAAELKSNLLGLPAFFSSNLSLPYDRSDYLWDLQRKSFTTDSLLVFALDPKILAAVGCGWFDDGLQPGQAYQYRISRVIRKDTIVLGEVYQHFPDNKYRGRLDILQFIPNGDEITLYYGLTDSVSTQGLKLYRSRFKENNYSEVPVSSGFTDLNDRTVAVVSDESVATGMAYSYVAVPYDNLGNLGSPSDTINIYNLTKIADMGIVTEMNAVGDKEKRGVTLSWKMKTDSYVQFYEVYRSKNYDKGYERIVTLPAERTTYFDDEIDPTVAYYYFVTMNNGFTTSLPSARVQVILEGGKANIIPPQNLVADLQGNVVTLTFNTIEPDTRSYQIFRGEGYTGDLSLYASLDAVDSVATFRDVLAQTIEPQTFSYAVADVNSSNSVSPLSQRVSIQYSGGMLPVPNRIDAQLRGREIFVIWDDVSKQNAFVAGYNLWRSTIDPEGKTEEEARIVASLSYQENSYTDTLLIPGKHYRYVVESVDINGETSSKSMQAGIRVPQQLPLAPGQVSAFASGERIQLSWDNPLDPSIRNIRVYRAATGAEATLLKELPADESNFEDLTAQKGVQYYYFVITVNTRGEESKWDEPVGGKIR